MMTVQIEFEESEEEAHTRGVLPGRVITYTLQVSIALESGTSPSRCVVGIQ